MQHSVAVQSDVNAAAERDRKPVLADRYKTRMCRNYEETGRCPYESKCMFAHGDAELRTTEMNLEDGLTTEEAIKAFQRQLIVQRQQAAQQEQAKLLAQQRMRPVVRQHDVYGHPAYATPAYGAYNPYYSCPCAECMAYAAPPPAPEEPCQCADCLAAYKSYDNYGSSAPVAMEP